MKQPQALAIMRRGDPVFLTGPAGSGKTYVLNKFIDWAKRQKKQIAVTASTGIAATHLGGTTIHSWSGLGIRDRLSSHDMAWLKSNATLAKRYNNTDILVIDEVSMLHGARLDMVNEVCKLLRNNQEPFGGLQVILTGDLFQLPPINREGGDDDFAHTSSAWQELNPRICYLSEQHRQGEGELIDILSAMRRGGVGDEHYELLNSRLGLTPPAGAVVTKLYTHNADVESMNQVQLAALPGEAKQYPMARGGRAQHAENLIKSVLAPELLELKIGAEVMFVANNFVSGFANGSRGQVVGFSGDAPIIRLLSTGREIRVEPHNWTREEDGKELARITQLPLRLAWAITIHKSQGMSLDSALIDLSRSFTYGMGYVALSRVRSLDGLYLQGINNKALHLHPDMYEFDRKLQAESAALAEEIGEVGEAAESTLPEPEAALNQSAEPDEGLLQKLRAWRSQKAASISMPPYIIAHDSHLEQLAAIKPLSIRQLLAVKGFGPKKVETYGDDILKLISEYLGQAIMTEPETPLDQQPTQADPVPESPYAQRRAATKADHPRAFERWQPEEDTKLLELFKAGEHLDAVCKTLQRQPAGVWARLGQLLKSRIESSSS